VSVEDGLVGRGSLDAEVEDLGVDEEVPVKEDDEEDVEVVSKAGGVATMVARPF